MPMKARNISPEQRHRTYLKDWRKARDWTLDDFVENLRDRRGIEMTIGGVSRIERGQTPYTQDFLEAAAALYDATPAELLAGPPAEGEKAAPILNIWARLEPNEQSRALQMLRLLLPAKASD